MRALIVDSSASLRDKLISLLSDVPDLHIIGEASTWDETLHLFRNLQIEIAIVDIHVLKAPEIQSIQHLKSSHPQVHLISLSPVFTPEYDYAYRKAGADRVFDKSVGIEKVVEWLTDLHKKK